MALFEDVFKGASLPGLAIGAGVVLLAPTLLPAIGRVARPAAKAIIRTGISLYREACTQVTQTVGPLVEEARQEMPAPKG
jgi:hypothetical protein